MAYRFTNTEKWQDVWFSNLKQLEMLLFLYLCDNCDIAGFIEINLKRWSADLGSSINTIQGALKGLERGLIYSKCGECFYIKNFLKHQKNLPININNKAHLGIVRRFELYSYKFDIQDISEFIEGASKGLPSPTGNGNGISNDTKEYVYNKFYDKEIEDSFNDENYINFVKVLFGNNQLKSICNNVLSLPEQCTYNQFKAIFNLKKEHNLILSDYIERMENWKELKKSNKYVSKTLINWINRDLKWKK